MAITFKAWLKLKFDKLISVQVTTLNSEYADLIIHCWSGNRIHVHMIDQSVNLRAVKKTITDATHAGINSLFLVDARVLPEDNERVQARDWMHALHALGDERIYAYRVTQDGPEVFQVHLEPIINTSDHKAWYGPKIKFDSLRHSRKSVKLRSIRGEWLIADFGAPDFWKNMDFRAARAQQERSQRFNTHWQDWSTFKTWRDSPQDDEDRGQSERKQATPIGDYLTSCYQLIGVEKGASQEDVKKAFRKRAMMYHPDTSELPAEEAEQRFKMLNAAFNYIKSANGW